MELHGKEIFDILGKPLDYVTKFFSVLADSNTFKSQGGSQGSHYKPSPSTHSPMTSSPLIPAFVVLLLGFLILSQTPIRVWLTEAKDLPTLGNIFSFGRKPKAPSLPKSGEAVSVWAKMQTGFYYCRGGTLFGDKPGKAMTQSEALTSGYRPVGGSYCTGSQMLVASADGTDPGSEPSPGSDDPAANADQASVLGVAGQPATPISSEDVKVWGLKQLGFYYCRGDALFGVNPGRIMRQADALNEGLLPSYHACHGSNANVASAGNPASGTENAAGTSNTSPGSMGRMALISEKPDKTSQDALHVSVWVKKEFGFYYCRNDVLFGNKPGQLMSQDAALTAGYQPSDGRCTSNKQTRATAERMSPRAFPGAK